MWHAESKEALLQEVAKLSRMTQSTVSQTQLVHLLNFDLQAPKHSIQEIDSQESALLLAIHAILQGVSNDVASPRFFTPMLQVLACLLSTVSQ